jgi:hypothetical protein
MYNEWILLDAIASRDSRGVPEILGMQTLIINNTIPTMIATANHAEGIATATIGPAVYPLILELAINLRSPFEAYIT